MSVSLVEVMAAASQRLAPLSGECAGHAVLAAADQLLANPRLVEARDVLIEENGAVRLGHGRAADPSGCDAALRALLDGLLTVAHSGGAGLLRVGRRAATGDLAQLVRELEVALIPANRAAARRSLARLYRETSRAREAGSLSAGPEPAALEPVVPKPVAPAPVAAEPVAVEPVVPKPVAAEPVAVEPVVPKPVAAEPVAPDAKGELLAVTEIRWATAPSPQREVDVELEVEVDVDVELEVTPAPTPVLHTQPLPKVEPRRVHHHTVPLPPVRPRPRVADHETPLEPVLSRRHAGPPAKRSAFPDIHQTPYLGTQVSAIPVYDERAREAWQVPTHAAVEAAPPAELEADESTTDPAPVVAWGAPDEDAALGEAASHEDAALGEAEAHEAEAHETEAHETEAHEAEAPGELAPLPACPALAVEPRVALLPPKEPRVFRPSDVEELVERFRIAEPEPDAQLARSLKQLAGITATPPPVLARADKVPPSPAPRTLPEPSDPGSSLRPKPTIPVSGS